MRYVRGEDFNAEEELYELLLPGMSSGHTRALVSLLGSLEDMHEHGFDAARHDWTRTGENEIWIFTDGPIRCAIHVPGDGLNNEGQATLLATAFAEGHAETVEWLADFVARAGRRLTEGQVVE